MLDKITFDKILLDKKEINIFAKKNGFSSVITSDSIKYIKNGFHGISEDKITLEYLKVIISYIDYLIIRNFYRSDLNEKATNDDKQKYINTFNKAFIESSAGILIKRKNIIGTELEIKVKGEYVFISFNLNKTINNLDLDEYISKLNSKEKRKYFNDTKIILLKKGTNKKDWDELCAYKDILYENKLIFENIKII